MGADNFLNNNVDIDSLRYERQNRLNKPDYAPGQGEGEDLFSSDFEQPVSSGGFDTFSQTGRDDLFSSSGGGDLFGSSGGGMAGQFNFGTSTAGGFNQPQQQQPKTDEDKFFDALVVGGKGFVGFFNDLFSSTKGLTPKFVSVYGKNVTITSVCVAVLGLVIRLFGFDIGLQLLIGGILSTAVGIVLLMFFVEKGAECTSQYKDDNSTNQNFNTPPQSLDTGFGDFGGNNDFDFGDTEFNDNSFGDDSSFDDDISFGDDDYGDEDETDFDFDTDLTEEKKDGEDIENVLDNLPDIDRGMYTRQFLYDSFTRVLPNLKTNFANVKRYDEDSEVFLSWDDIIQRASAVTGLKDDDIPYLKELEENLFTIKATINRTPKMKPDLIGEEVAKAYAYNEYDNDEDRARVFAKVETVLDECIITVFTGASHMISLKDMYSKSENFVLNKKNTIPVVLGINEKGNVITADFKKIESIIIAGMPRSGKSWLVQAILTQMCALLPPSELNIFFLDPKAGTSDFKNFTLPHVKKFASKYTDSNGVVVNKEYTGILDVLRWVVNVEAPRRKKLIGDHGKVNINDFKASHPDVKLPVIYIVIDEMVTLSEMVKEEEKEYQSYLKMIVTQFPNLGIKGMFIPHEVKNQIIDKTAYDSIKARISVKGSPEHIEASTGTKPRAFPYKLANVGDMAVNIDTISVSTLFVHGVALTDDNDKNVELFNYIRRFWAKYAPEEFNDSVAKGVDDNKYNEKLLSSINSDDDTHLDFLFDEGQSEDSSINNEVSNNINDNGLSSISDLDSDEDDFLSDFR